MHTQSKPFSTFVRGLIVVSLALTVSVSNAAEVLFQQAVVDPTDGYQSDVSAGFLNGDDFSVAHVNVESISWWGSYFNRGTDDFVVKLFDDLSDTPDSVSALSGSMSVSSTLLDANLQEFYRYQLDLSTPLELLAGNYFLSIHNVGTSEWVWLFGSPGNGTTIFNFAPDTDWAEDSSLPLDMAFSLEGSRIQTIPEPTMLMLLLLGFSLLIVTHKGMQNTMQA